jgi:hypothetical protein
MRLVVCVPGVADDEMWLQDCQRIFGFLPPGSGFSSFGIAWHCVLWGMLKPERRTNCQEAGETFVRGYCSYVDPVQKYERDRACGTGKRKEVRKVTNN